MYKIFIAWRFLWSRLVSYIGAGLLAFAVMLFIIVMAVMEGMGEFLRENISKSDAHVQLLAPAGPGLDGWEALMERISRAEHVTGVTPFVRGLGEAEATSYSFKCLVRGVDLDLEWKYGGLGPYLSGEMNFAPRAVGEFPRAIVGARIADQMEILEGDRIRLSVQKAGDPDATGRMMFEIGGEFKTDSIWFDNSLLISLEDAQRLLGTGDLVTGLGVWIDDYRLAHKVKRSIQLSLVDLDPEEETFFRCLSSERASIETLAERAGVGLAKAGELISRLVLDGAAREVRTRSGHYYVEHTEPQVKTWAEQHPDLFRGVAHEATIMRIILFIVIGFVGLLVLCLLWILVEQKVRDIGILVALGAGRWGVVSIFVIDGLLIGLAGTAAGLVFGTLIAWNVDWLADFFGLKVFPPDTFYGAESLPSVIRARDLILVATVAIACSVVASILPAFRAATADPIESLRHE